MFEWNQTGIESKLLGLIEKAGFKNPTEVQAKSIPLALEGSDLIVSSQTGSGKTASFVLPTVQRFVGMTGTFGLVLAPTREIAQQTQAVFETFGAPMGLKSVVLIGGIAMRTDADALQTYPHILIATPGRLCDHLDRGNIWLDYIKVLVLDEADRMLDMGFSSQLNRIMEDLPAERQTMVFSATFNPAVDRLVQKITRNPKRIEIGSHSTAPERISQQVIYVREDEKIHALRKLINKEPGTIMVFTRSKDRATDVWTAIYDRKNPNATYIHSGCTQVQRERALAEFKSGKYRIIVATDIAGRGIDVHDIAHVVNYDLPEEPEDYVHRIGRTGRQGKSGHASTFATNRDRALIGQIEKVMGQKLDVTKI